MKPSKSMVSLALALLMLAPSSLFASSHREAPITALDRTADVTDWYAFVSYDHPDRVTMILNVDPFLEPANGPNYFPFDPNVLYEMKVDNNQDGIEDVTFQFRFATEIRQPGLFTGFVGGIAGIRGQSLIVNLPGKPSAIRDCLLAVFPAIPYAIDLIEGPYLTTHEAVVKAFRPKASSESPFLSQKQCPGQDLNLHDVTRCHLKAVRLPIPPPGRGS